MKLFDYLDIRFKIISLEKQKKFSTFKDGQLNAIRAILGFQRFIGKIVSIPTLIIQFYLTKLSILDMPVDPLKQTNEEIAKLSGVPVEEINKQTSEMEAAKEARLKAKAALQVVKNDNPSPSA